MKKLSSFALGVITTLLVISLSVSALAASGAIKLEVNPIGVLVNGEEFKPKDAKGNDVLVFVYNGTTYAPLRALAEAYGLEVGYDTARGVATVDKPSYDTDIALKTDSIQGLSAMTYEEFKACLSHKTEVGDLLDAPSNKGVSYHYYLTFGDNIDNVKFTEEWDAFLKGNADTYLNQLLQEYVVKAPYNIVSLHIWYNDGELKCLTAPPQY